MKRMLIEGDPGTAIVQFARDEKAGLIAMPTHGYGTFRRFLRTRWIRFCPDWKQKLASSATQPIAKLQLEAGTKAEVIIESGDAAKVLDQAGRQIKADVLVVGRPSHGRLRATGYGIIRESHIPVLSV